MNQTTVAQNVQMSGTDSQQLPTSDTLLSQSVSSSINSQQLANSTTSLNTQANNLVSNVNNMNRYGMMGNSYGSSMYNNGYSSYGGYGSSYGGGMMGSSMYGGGFQNMNMMNQQNPQNPQQLGFRDEYQGVLMGFNSMLNIIGAGIGMIGYGTTFVQTAKKALVFIFQGFTNLSYKILGIAYLKKLYNWMTSQDLQKDFARTFEVAGKAEKSSFAKRLLGKALIVIRVLSGLAILGFYFAQYKLRKRMNQMQLEQESLKNFNEELGPIIFENQINKNKDESLIQINMNSDKADIVDELDAALNEEQEEEKENLQESNKESQEELTAEISESSENIFKIENLQDAFDNVINKEKNYIQQTQVRSEEFWKHTEPNTEFVSEVSNNIPSLVATQNVSAAAVSEITIPTFTSSEDINASINTTALATPITTTTKKAAKPWMKNV